ncbi:Serine/threonine-protein kinase PrkC [Bhargavaea cecembensis DSE10]|uniref:Serine/threonine-protein kinase PrkC n=1 Tax=Bhargavaea cecembensis DSE10 TaxID=1235279 RepID=M7NFG3_9BACL|nr:protein kinase [Bhargavaea cecembensis]EMR05997.1 Serine/threonine-protein kinase PrkC [Bhargavaea cecembensis DSE10]
MDILRVTRKIRQFFVDWPIREDTVLQERYQVSDVIGAGSYGIIYLCTDLRTKEKTVVKQLRPSRRYSKKEIAMFRKEMAIMKKLDHPNLPVFIDDFSDDDQHLYYAMTFIEADNLEEQIFSGQQSFDEEASLQILYRLLKIVEYLHGKGIYHQDLRIPNILISHGDLYLIDFGLSVCENEAVKPAGQCGKHNSIEQLRLQDYYDLGEILLYLLYTTYTPKNKKALPWTEELSLNNQTVHLLKRLLGIMEPYGKISEIAADLQDAVSSIRTIS